MVNIYEIEKVNKDEVNKILNSYDIKKMKYTYKNGLYYYLDTSNNKKIYVGVDNTTNDAWMEDFKDLKSCKKWLRNG